MNVINNFLGIDAVITDIKLYKNNVLAVKKFSFGTWSSRQHVFVSIATNGCIGYGENIITVNEPNVDLTQWQTWLSEIKGLTVSNAILHVQKKLGDWCDRITEMSEMCLIDLAGKVTKQNALSMLNLVGTTPVYGAYVILSDDLSFVKERTQWAVENNKAEFIKVKLFGRPSLDKAIIETVRCYAPRKTTYLMGDVNGGYRMHKESADIADIAFNLSVLHKAGLDACEDPAYMSNDEWVELQSASESLMLIPDYPMRPAREAINTIKKGMGHIYNIHPGCSASIFDAIELAYKVRELGAKLMIGDDSLIGPGCTIWQQLALGLSADWVEATEKPSESDAYYTCVKQLATNSNTAPITTDTTAYGFGIELDDNKLASIASEVYTV